MPRDNLRVGNALRGVPRAETNVGFALPERHGGRCPISEPSKCAIHFFGRSLPPEDPMTTTGPLKIACIGCGARAQTYTQLAARRPERFQIVAAADPLPERVEKLRRISGPGRLPRLRRRGQLLAAGKIADVMIVATQDNDHYAHCRGRAGGRLRRAPGKADRHPGRRGAGDPAAGRPGPAAGDGLLCAPLRRLLPESEGDHRLRRRIGEVVSIQANEGVMPWHQAHSFVRGHWSVAAKSSPMIISKCCHDVDILHWLVGRRVPAGGEFRLPGLLPPASGPPPAPPRCTDGCPVGDACPYNALRYAHDMRSPWLAMVYDRAADATPEEIAAWLRSSPWGRCVWRCDNDAVDRQVLALEFDGGVTGTFTMTAFESGRHLEVYGTRGVLKGGETYHQHFGST